MNRHIGIVLCLILGVIIPVFGSGWITVRTSVLGAQVTIDDMAGVQMRVHELSFEVEEGLHLVIMDKAGYYPTIDTITIHDGENQLVPMWLEPITPKAQQHTSRFQRISWDYQLQNGLFALRWFGIGGGLGTGLNVHLSLFDLRYGLLSVEPCLWGINLPFFSSMTHAQRPWLVHPRDRRSPLNLYEMAIPGLSVQFYYTPMVGVVLPFGAHTAFTISAAPQISWTRVDWSCQMRELPSSYRWEYTNDPFPNSGFYFDPVWFSVQLGILFNGSHSDILTYLKYQDGYFIGVDFRF